MKCRETVHIAATPEQVWAHIADPLLMSGWNPKMVEVHRGASGPVRLGESYRATFRMSGKGRGSAVEVVECREPHWLVLRHHQPDRPAEHVDLIFELTADKGGCTVTQWIDLGRSRVPWFLRGVIWLIHRFGEPVGKPYLQQLKEQVEREETPRRPSIS